MKKAIIATIAIILLSGAATAEQKFLVDATFYNNTSAEINNVRILDADRTTSLRKVKSNFTIEAADKSGKVLKKGFVPLSFQTNVRTRQGGYVIEKDEVEKRIFLKYNRNVTSIQIKQNGEQKATYDLIKQLCSNYDGECSSYCSGKEVDVDCTCGDGICQQSTNETELCPQDCSSPKNTGSEQKNSSSENQVKEVVDRSYSTYILIAVIIAAVLIGLFLLSGRVKIEA